MKNRYTIFTTILLAPVCFALSRTVQAVSPPPDGDDGNRNTPEGGDVSFNLTTNSDNTSVGLNALYSNNAGGFNTADGVAAFFIATRPAATTQSRVSLRIIQRESQRHWTIHLAVDRCDFRGEPPPIKIDISQITSRLANFVPITQKK